MGSWENHHKIIVIDRFIHDFRNIFFYNPNPHYIIIMEIWNLHGIIGNHYKIHNILQIHA